MYTMMGGLVRGSDDGYDREEVDGYSDDGYDEDTHQDTHHYVYEEYAHH